MRVHVPSSCAHFRPGFSIFDAFWAALSPLLALYVRGAYILSAEGAATAALYCGISFVFALIAFLAFRLNDGISRYFSVHDAVNILKASSVAGLLTAVVLFTFTRLGRNSAFDPPYLCLHLSHWPYHVPRFGPLARQCK